MGFGAGSGIIHRKALFKKKEEGMKKILVILTIIGMMAAPVFAQGDIMEAAGTVDSINPIDPSRGDYDGGIVLKDTDSAVRSFDINTTTVISDQSTGRIDSGDIRDGDKVRVKYSVSDLGPVAITVLRLPAYDSSAPAAMADKKAKGN